MTFGTFALMRRAIEYALAPHIDRSEEIRVNLEQARFNMIQQQVRTWEVLDARVLEVLQSIPREEFVPARHRKLAFSDLRIPLGHDQVMMRPVEQGRLLQALALKETDRVLEVGTGSGFLTACLAALSAQVTSIELYEDLAQLARSNIEGHAEDRIELRTGDFLAGNFDAGAFDAVVVTSSVASVPRAWTELLAPGGRMFVVRGNSPAMEAAVLTHDVAGGFTEEGLYETDLPRLVGAEDVPEFKF